jgi:hypothetical protein
MVPFEPLHNYQQSHFQSPPILSIVSWVIKDHPSKNSTKVGTMCWILKIHETLLLSLSHAPTNVKFYEGSALHIFQHIVPNIW